MFTPEQEVRLNNFEAQYSIILSNISNANKELESIQKQRNQAKIEAGEEKARLDGEIKEKTKELETLLVSKSVVQKEIKKQEASVVQTVKKEKDILETIKELSRKENILNQEIRTKEAKKDKLGSEINAKNCKIDVLVRKLDELSGEVSRLSCIKKALKEETTKSEKELEVMKNNLISELTNLSIDIEKLSELRRIEESKIVDADKHLNKEKAQIARRERDIVTITKRLEKLFQEVKPGTVLKI